MNDLLPERPRRKKFIRVWIVLLALCIVGVVSIAIFKARMSARVDQQLERLKKSGYPITTVDLNVWHSAVPMNENAALKVLQADVLLSTNSNKAYKLRWDEEEKLEQFKAEAQSLLDENEAALSELENALKLTQSRYPVDWRPGPATLLPHLHKVRTFGELLRMQTGIACLKKDGKEASGAIVTLFKLFRTLDTEPCLVSQYNRAQLVSEALSSLEKIMNECPLTKDQLSELLREVEKTEKSNERALSRGLVGDLCLGTYVFTRPTKEILNMVDEGNLPGYFPLSFVMMRASGLHQRDFAFHLKMMALYLQASEQPFPKAFQEVRQVQEQYDEKIKTASDLHLSKMIMPHIDDAVARFAVQVARLGCAATALSAQLIRMQRGTVPQTLEGVGISRVDPFDGQPLRFRGTAEGFVVYSIGPDLKDDSGARPEKSPGGDVFQRRGKNSELKGDLSFTVWKN